jgi:hypothetical protein
MSNVLVDYLTMACAGTGQSSFYNTREEQEAALVKAHGNLMRDNRRVYALSAALPINDRSRQMVLENLLGTGKLCEDGELENHVIKMVVADMQFNRVLNLFMTLREKKVNNTRTRKLGLAIWARIDAFRAIKYANKVRTLLRHCHIPEGDDPAKAEIHRWVFGGNKNRPVMKADDIKHNPKLKSRLLAPTNYEKCFDLPFDIARDIAVAHHGKKADEFQREFAGHGNKEGKGTVTRKESLRARKQTGDSTVDFNRFSIFDLLMHGYRTPGDRVDIVEMVKEKALGIAAGLNLPEKVAVVVDNSTSSIGSAERQFQPLAMISAVATIVGATDAEVSFHYTGPEPDGWIKAEGATNLRRPFVDALLTRPQLVVILSDGYENVRAGSINSIMSTKAVQESGISIMHLNPVAAVESGQKARSLSDKIMTFGLSAPEQLPMVTLFGLAAQDPALLEPMFAAVEENVRQGNYKAARLATRVAGLPALV